MPDKEHANQLLDSLRKLDWLGVLVSGLGTAVAAVSTAATLTSAIVPSVLLLAGVVLALVALQIVLTAVITRLKRGPSKVADLKDRLERAYVSALDESPLNPQRAGANHRA